jgi:tetratricopeptide (TPR) repeat protein
MRKFSGWSTCISVIAGFLLLTDFAFTQDVDNPQNDVIYLSRAQQNGDKYVESLTQGWYNFEVGNTPGALEEFEKVLSAKDALESETVQALYGLGLTHQYSYQIGAEKKAAKHFQRIVDEFSRNNVAPWALLALGELQGVDSDEQRSRATQYYQQVLEKYPDSIAIHEAALQNFSASSYDMNHEVWSEKAALLEEHLNRYPINPLATTMHYRLTAWYGMNYEHKKALYHNIIIGKKRMCDPFRWSGNWWGIAQTLYYFCDLPELSILWHQKILDYCPRSRLRLPARQRIEAIQHELQQKSSANETEAES